MGFIKRLLGICQTPAPADMNCWHHEKDRVVVDLNRTPELRVPYGAIRLESKSLPDRILIFNGGDQQFHAFYNRCTHMGRRIDPVPESEAVACCSVSASTYDYSGHVTGGPAKGQLTVLPLMQSENSLYIRLEG